MRFALSAAETALTFKEGYTNQKEEEKCMLDIHIKSFTLMKILCNQSKRKKHIQESAESICIEVLRYNRYIVHV